MEQRFKLGEKVFWSDQHNWYGPAKVIAVKLGCDCCDANPDDYYYHIEGTHWHHDCYVYSSVNDAKDSLNEWKEFRDRHILFRKLITPLLNENGLLPCPHCGNPHAYFQNTATGFEEKDPVSDKTRYVVVRCPGCGASSGTHWRPQSVRSGWNRRVECQKPITNG